MPMFGYNTEVQLGCTMDILACNNYKIFKNLFFPSLLQIE